MIRQNNSQERLSAASRFSRKKWRNNGKFQNKYIANLEQIFGNDALGDECGAAPSDPNSRKTFQLQLHGLAEKDFRSFMVQQENI